MSMLELSSNCAHEMMSRAMALASSDMLPELSTQNTRSTTEACSPWLSALLVTSIPFGLPSTSTHTFWPGSPVPSSLIHP